jgi:chemotaxis protein MotB
MARKHKHEEHENHERWLVSYADFMTLLFAFFVVMYASSRVDTNKLASNTQGIRWALNYKGTGGITKLALFKGPPSEGGCVAGSATSAYAGKQQLEVMENTRRKLNKSLRPFLQRKETSQVASMEIQNGQLHIRLAAEHFFDAASAALRPESIAVLDAIATELASTAHDIRVEGHTDDGSLRSTRYRNNWDLSASRAATVVTFLEEAHDFAPTRLTAAGLGSSHPQVSNDTPDHRALNRRIELVLELPPADPRAYAPPSP